MEAPTQSFIRQAVSMTWDFAESNPFGGSSGNALDAAEWVAEVVQGLPLQGSQP